MPPKADDRRQLMQQVAGRTLRETSTALHRATTRLNEIGPDDVGELHRLFSWVADSAETLARKSRTVLGALETAETRREG